MPSDPVKLQIRDNLLAAMRAINRGDGYHTDAGKNVSKLVVPVIEITRFPWLIVYTMPEEAADQNAGPTRRSKTRFAVQGYVKSTTPDDDLLKLEADVKKAAVVDIGRGGLAIETVFESTDPDYSDLSDHGTAAFRSVFAVTANWSPTAP